MIIMGEILNSRPPETAEEKLVQIFMDDISLATALSCRFAQIVGEHQAGKVSRDYGEGFAEAVRIVLAVKSPKASEAMEGWVDYADGDGAGA